jgi:hypothetical protein
MAPTCTAVSWLIVSQVQSTVRWHRTSGQVGSGQQATGRCRTICLITMCGEFNQLCADAVGQLGILLIVSSVGATCISNHDTYVPHTARQHDVFTHKPYCHPLPTPYISGGQQAAWLGISALGISSGMRNLFGPARCAHIMCPRCTSPRHQVNAGVLSPQACMCFVTHAWQGNHCGRTVTQYMQDTATLYCGRHHVWG